jgi:NADH:ubiquinone oxidoreductase subunit 6 (subunit J)
MPLLAETYNLPISSAGQLVLGSILALAGCFLLLPKPRARMIGGGAALLVAALIILATWAYTAFGRPMPDAVGTVLFWLFSAGALIFGIVLVVQRNPARGAIAFAFVILSTCGLFLLLAAPFLMAATIIVYAGAIVVTFLFVLMLSQTRGPSDENDRSREPLLGSLAGFAFTGLVLFTLQQSQQDIAAADAETAEIAASSPLPAPALTPEDQRTLRDVSAKLRELESNDFYSGGRTGEERIELLNGVEQSLEEVVGLSAIKQSGTIREGSIPRRLSYRSDLQSKSILAQVEQVRQRSGELLPQATNAVYEKPSDADLTAIRANARALREEVTLLAGAGELPARNVSNLGTILYAEHLLAVELAGTLLLVATIGAIAIAQRKGVAA